MKPKYTRTAARNHGFLISEDAIICCLCSSCTFFIEYATPNEKMIQVRGIFQREKLQLCQHLPGRASFFSAFLNPISKPKRRFRLKANFFPTFTIIFWVLFLTLKLNSKQAIFEIMIKFIQFQCVLILSLSVQLEKLCSMSLRVLCGSCDFIFDINQSLSNGVI